MEQSGIKELTITELQNKLGECKKLYADSKMAYVISSLEKPIQLCNVRRTIVRLASELTKRELQQFEPALWKKEI